MVDRGEQIYATLFATTELVHLSAVAIAFYEDGSDQAIYLSDCGNARCYAQQIYHGSFQPDAIDRLTVFVPGTPDESTIALAVHIESRNQDPIDAVLPSAKTLMAAGTDGGLDHFLSPGIFKGVDMLEVIENLISTEEDEGADQTAEAPAPETCESSGHSVH